MVCLKTPLPMLGAVISAVIAGSCPQIAFSREASASADASLRAINARLASARSACQAELKAGQLKSYADLADCDNAGLTHAFLGSPFASSKALAAYEKTTLDIALKVDRRRLSPSDARIEATLASRALNHALADQLGDGRINYSAPPYVAPEWSRLASPAPN